MLKLYYFSADFCQPCKTYAPIVERVCQQTGVELIKIDIGTDEGSEVAVFNRVRSVPTVILKEVVGDGEIILVSRPGAMTENGLKTLIGSVGA